MRFTHRRIRVVVGFALLVASSGVPAAAAVDFEKHVAPVLIKRCLGCHNSSAPSGKLDLSRRASAYEGGESGDSAVAPGKVDESFLIQQLRDGEMPPKGKGKSVTKEELANLTAWIRAGAKWPEGRTLSEFEFTTESRAGQDWWSLQPVKRPPIPKLDPKLDPKQIRTPVDAFILSRLKDKGLSPSKPATKQQLLRRVTFDVTGLPPTYKEVVAFQADQSPDAYEKVVERLLASPRYGERWARHWLDVAHYADTHGFERDFRRDNAWPYRDYVIAAFNSDKPYNDFIREQIAGDVIDPNDPAKIVATGFLGAGPWDVTGLMETRNPVLKRQARANVLDDMVTTVIATTMGLTINCSRCHNHKFDPILQEDYYRLWAVFAGSKRADRKLPQSKQRDGAVARIQQLEAEIRSVDGAPVDLADIVGGGSGFGTGKKGRGIDVRTGKPSKGHIGYVAGTVNKFIAAEPPFVDGVFIPDGGAGGKTRVPITSTGLNVTGLTDTTTKSWDYIQNGPSESQASSVLSGINYDGAGHTQLALHANKGITFDLAAIRNATKYGRLRFRAVAGCGSAGYSDFWVYVDGKLKTHKKGIANAQGAHPVDILITPDQRFLTLIATDGGNGISHDQIFFGDPVLIHDPENANSVVRANASRRTKLITERDALIKKLGHLPSASKVVYAITSGKSPAVHLLARGDTEAPGKQVMPGAIGAVYSVPAEFGKADMPDGQRRLALADWIVDPKNPLTRRVIVNRIWHYHFGRGLVDTPSDFGFNGGRPSHPQLLDWLADELLKQNWSIKSVHRLILLSNTYRQASTFNEKAAAIDADNRLLWRMNRQRLEAEAVRDAILATTGKLNLKAGGPGYRDFQYIQRYAPIYKYITADKPELWRRTVYRFTVRSVSNPFMDVLDCPNPSNLVPVRGRTTTALQALALLNNEFMLQQAEYLAVRVREKSGQSAEDQAKLAYQLAFSRSPTADEVRAAADFVQTQSLFHFCRMLLNSNEFLYID